MLDFIDDFTIQSILIINFFILFFWFGFLIKDVSTYIINAIFNLRKRKNAKR